MKRLFGILLFTFSLPLLAKSQFVKLEDYLFYRPPKGMHTEVLLLAKDNKIYYEKYLIGTKNTRHLLWSMSKSISSLIFGIAESKGLINRNDSLYKYYQKEIDLLGDKRKQELSAIKIQDLLEMASGLGWNEFYEEDPFNSHVVRMLYFAARKSMPNYVLSIPKRYEPGTHFYYSSGDSNLYMGALQKVVPAELKNSYPWKYFFDPMEMDAIFEQDNSGVFAASSYAYLTPPDLLKLGNLIINKGMYKGKQVVPKEYIEFATSLSQTLQKGNCLKEDKMTYGAQFWLNASCPDGRIPFKDAPSNLVMFLGHGGQSVFVFPDEKIVAVRIAQDDGKIIDKNKYAKLILESFK